MISNLLLLLVLAVPLRAAQYYPVIEDFSASKEHVADSVTEYQVTDIFRFKAYTGYTRRCSCCVLEQPVLEQPVIDPDAVFLFIYDYSWSKWVAASADVTYSEGDGFQVEKPLIGYELTKHSECGYNSSNNYTYNCYKSASEAGEYLKCQSLPMPLSCDVGLQPFEYNRSRWGDPSCGEEISDIKNSSLCYLVVVSTGESSVSQMYPESCASYAPGEEDTCAANIVPTISGDSDHACIKSGITETCIDKFKITIHNLGFMNIWFKFICKVKFTYYGGAIDMTPPNSASDDVDVYYKSSSSQNWGSPLLNLNHNGYNHNNGRNKYKSTVHVLTLLLQGVEQSGCYKCEATANGYPTDSMYYPNGCEL